MKIEKQTIESVRDDLRQLAGCYDYSDQEWFDTLLMLKMDIMQAYDQPNRVESQAEIDAMTDADWERKDAERNEFKRCWSDPIGIIWESSRCANKALVVLALQMLADKLTTEFKLEA
jgi:hypothetical protein